MIRGSPVRALCGAWLVTALGCADLRDVLTPYRPRAPEIAAVLAQPWPAAVLDVGLVLGCPATPEGTLSACQRCRVEAAVRVYRSGQVRRLLLSGGAAHSPHVEAEVMAAAVIDRGVPPGHVLREPRALTTWQNVRYAARIMKANELHSALLISTADHLPRARRIARHYGLGDARTAYLACDR